MNLNCEAANERRLQVTLISVEVVMCCCVAAAAAAAAAAPLAAAGPSESRSLPSPDYLSPCLRLRPIVAAPPSPSLRGPVSLRPPQRVTQPRERERERERERVGQVIQGQVRKGD